MKKFFLICLIALLAISAPVRAESEETSSSTPSTPTISDVFTEEQRAATVAESHPFQAEVHRLMDIIINSLYTNREIFLRELISNAADACDKIRYLSLTRPELLGEGEDGKLEVKISMDRTARTLTVRDTGIGMTKKQLTENLGILAKSGTTEFLQAASKSSSDTLSLIGQFGVGFYSVYLVADKVTVISKNHDDDQYVWESTAEASFTIFKDPRGDTLKRGTEIVLHLKEDSDEFLSPEHLERIVTKYSEFVNFPIFIRTSKTVDKEIDDEEDNNNNNNNNVDDNVEVSEEEEKPKKKKTISETVHEWKRVNDVKAIWTRPSKDISENEYNEFYKALSKDDKDPLTRIHFSAEGEISFKSLLYIPSKAPAGLYEKLNDKQEGLRLFVRRVMISDQFDDFLPKYFNFIKGVVDSDDLPLNVNREQLAQSKVLKIMAKKITRKVLEMLTKMSEQKNDNKNNDDNNEEDNENEPSYLSFWNEFGKSIKLGILDDRINRVKLSKLLRYSTSKSNGELVSLDEYVARMKPTQKHIYYITGESIESLMNSPFMEKLNNKDYEVVFMIDALDEYLIQTLTEYDGHPLQSITKENFKLDGEKSIKKIQEEFSGVTKYLKDTYSTQIEKVVVSTRSVSQPCILVSSQFGMSANLERIMRAHTFGSNDNKQHQVSKKVMEINPYHPIIKSIKEKIENDHDNPKIKELAWLLFDSASLSSGYALNDPTEFANRINNVVANELGVADHKVEVPQDDEENEKANNNNNEEEESEHHDEL